MSSQRKTAIVTGASQGIGAGIVKAFVERGFNVVANSRKVNQSTEVAASDHVALVEGHIGETATASKFGSGTSPARSNSAACAGTSGGSGVRPSRPTASSWRAAPSTQRCGSGTSAAPPSGGASADTGAGCGVLTVVSTNLAVPGHFVPSRRHMVSYLRLAFSSQPGIIALNGWREND